MKDFDFEAELNTLLDLQDEKKKLTFKQALIKGKKLEKKGFRLTKKIRDSIIRQIVKDLKND